MDDLEKHVKSYEPSTKEVLKSMYDDMHKILSPLTTPINVMMVPIESLTNMLKIALVTSFLPYKIPTFIRKWNEESLGNETVLYKGRKVSDKILDLEVSIGGAVGAAGAALSGTLLIKDYVDYFKDRPLDVLPALIIGNALSMTYEVGRNLTQSYRTRRQKLREQKKQYYQKELSDILDENAFKKLEEAEKQKLIEHKRDAEYEALQKQHAYDDHVLKG